MQGGPGISWSRGMTILLASLSGHPKCRQNFGLFQGQARIYVKLAVIFITHTKYNFSLIYSILFGYAKGQMDLIFLS